MGRVVWPKREDEVRHVRDGLDGVLKAVAALAAVAEDQVIVG